MSLDIILYAVVAAVLIARLWVVLGRRNEEDSQRPNPFAIPAPEARSTEDPAKVPEPPLLLQPFHAPPESLAGKLERVKALDPSFDEKNFLREARTTFQTIVENFAKGDLGLIEPLLGPHVLQSFRAALEARKKSGHTMENRIMRIKDAETVSARVEDTRESITVRFVSEQENLLRDAGGKVIGGAEGTVEEITDTWTFERDTKSNDPKWILVATHS